MKRAITRIWRREIASTFLAGFFFILPLALTLWIVGWMAGKLRDFFGPGSAIGEHLRAFGLRFIANETVATVVGWVLVLVGFWLLGLFVRSTARLGIVEGFNRVISNVPLVRAVYRPIFQVVGMLRQQDHEGLKAMSVVFCSFGEAEGGGFLALLASEGLFRFREQDCRLVFIPTSPLPMTGGLVFVPANVVQRIEMRVEDMMKVYLSVGVLATVVVPEKYHSPVVSPQANHETTS